VAGKGRGEKDPRNKWPQTIQCIRDIRPRYALLENVPGLLNSGYFPEILGSLAEAGFDARWIVLGADDVGAPHRRKRLWILAYPQHARPHEPQKSGSNEEDVRGATQRTHSTEQFKGVGASRDVADSDTGRIQSDKTLRTGGIASDDGSQHVADSRHAEPSGRVQAAEGQQSGAGWETWSEPASRSMEVADSDSDDGWTGSGTVAQGRGSRLEHRRGSTGQSVGRSGEDVADSESARLQTRPGDRVGTDHGSRRNKGQSEGACGETGDVADSSRLGMEGSGADREQEPPISPGSEISGRDSTGSRATHWPPEPNVGRITSDGLAHRVDRLKAIGNGQVSRVAAVAWRILNDSN
jgi:site-specific DNA-cytosine methylase